jgi:hypothetical protein
MIDHGKNIDVTYKKNAMVKLKALKRPDLKCFRPKTT